MTTSSVQDSTRVERVDDISERTAVVTVRKANGRKVDYLVSSSSRSISTPVSKKKRR
jgi:hypothetical protein